MMGLRQTETCRVKIKEINAQNKQLHPLVTLLQYWKESWNKTLEFVLKKTGVGFGTVLNRLQILKVKIALCLAVFYPMIL